MTELEHMQTAWQAHFARKVAAQAAPDLDAPPPYAPMSPDLNLPIGPTVTYRSTVITTLPEGPQSGAELRAPLDPLGADAVWATEPAEGVTLVHEQGWRMTGVTLGRLLHAMSLAPGEVSQVAITGWRRKTRGRTAESVAEDERVSRESGRERDISSVTTGVANEVTVGGSSTTAESGQSGGGVGGLLGLVTGSMSGTSNQSSAATASFNVGSRSVAADSTEKVSQATHQHAASTRGRHAAIVKEVGQSETEQFQTRVVANYNRTHALNMLYFQVLQNYTLSTRIVDAQRCLFLPMSVKPFDGDRIRAFAAPLARGARAMGRLGLARALETIAEAEAVKKNAHVVAREAHKEARAATATARQSLRDAEKALRVAHADFLKAEISVRHLMGERTALVRRNAHEVRHLRAVATGGGLEQAIENAGNLVGVEAQFEVSMTRLNAELSAARTLESEKRTVHDAARAAVMAADAVARSARKRAAQAEAVLHEAEEAEAHAFADLERDLDAERLLFSQVIWSQLDPAQVASMIAGREHRGVSLAATLDPMPISVVGNYVGFRWNFPAEQAASAEAFRQRHLRAVDDDPADRRTITLPTGGVFAEAAPGQSNSAEKVDLRRFWKWDDNTIPILPTAIAKLHHVARAQRAAAAAGALGASGVALQSLPDAPAGPGHALAGVVGASLFRDLTGGDVIESLLKEAQEVTGANAEAAQLQAHQQIGDLLDHLENMAPKVAQFIANQGKGQGPSQSAEGESATNIGGVKNAVAEGEEGLDVGSLLGEAAELGLFL